MEPDLSQLARTLGDPTRMRMLALLMEGRALTAKELALGVDVQAATASAHIQKLLQENLITLRSQGRHKYISIASPEVASCVESLMHLATRSKPLPSKVKGPMRRARFCYDHLAGELGVSLCNALIAKQVLQKQDDHFVITSDGESWFQELGISHDTLQSLRQKKRKFATPCLDWSERCDHLAGSLAATLAEHALAAGWITREKHSRVVHVSAEGERALLKFFDIDFSKSNKT